MKYQIAQTKLQALSGRLHYMLLVSICLLISNIFLVWLVIWSLAHQKMLIVPAEIRQPFSMSGTSVDASYLRQMALFFVAERLNITPSNVEQNHKIILQHTDSRFYHKFVDVLGKEKQAIIKQNISSVFYPEDVVTNTKELKALIKGVLVHWVGNTTLSQVKKHYLIKFDYKTGDLKVLSFAELAELSGSNELNENDK